MLACRVVAIEGGELSDRRGGGKSAQVGATCSAERATTTPNAPHRAADHGT
jgi:hypothetical protein